MLLLVAARLPSRSTLLFATVHRSTPVALCGLFALMKRFLYTLNIARVCFYVL